MKHVLPLWCLTALFSFLASFLFMDGNIDGALFVVCLSTIILGFTIEAFVDLWTWYKRPSLTKDDDKIIRR